MIGKKVRVVKNTMDDFYSQYIGQVFTIVENMNGNVVGIDAPDSRGGNISFWIVGVELEVIEYRMRSQEHYNSFDLTDEDKKEENRWFCKNCQGELKKHFDYCPSCGVKIDW